MSIFTSLVSSIGGSQSFESTPSTHTNDSRKTNDYCKAIEQTEKKVDELKSILDRNPEMYEIAKNAPTPNK